MEQTLLDLEPDYFNSQPVYLQKQVLRMFKLQLELVFMIHLGQRRQHKRMRKTLLPTPVT